MPEVVEVVEVEEEAVVAVVEALDAAKTEDAPSRMAYIASCFENIFKIRN